MLKFRSLPSQTSLSGLVPERLLILYKLHKRVMADSQHVHDVVEGLAREHRLARKWFNEVMVKYRLVSLLREGVTSSEVSMLELETQLRSLQQQLTQSHYTIEAQSNIIAEIERTRLADTGVAEVKDQIAQFEAELDILKVDVKAATEIFEQKKLLEFKSKQLAQDYEAAHNEYQFMQTQPSQAEPAAPDGTDPGPRDPRINELLKLF